MNIQGSLVYHLRHLPSSEWVGKIPAHTQQDDFRLVVTPFKEVGLRHVDRSAHGTSFSAYYLSRFLQHNPYLLGMSCFMLYGIEVMKLKDISTTSEPAKIIDALFTHHHRINGY